MARREKQGLGVSVLEAARDRIAWAFDTFPRICCSFSGGKDSTVMTHLVADEARLRGRTFGLLFVDLEAQYKLTIEHCEQVFREYADCCEPYWLSLPIKLRNAVSQFEPRWMCWEPGKEWVRQPLEMSIADEDRFDWFQRGMEFEELIPAFSQWYSQGKPTATFVGIRSDESLNRWRTIAGHGRKWKGRRWTNCVGHPVWNVYPIYDWRTEDLWTYTGRFGKSYNRLYDRMYQAGLTIHQMRICQPYGDDQRKGLWLFHLIEPETWGRVVQRVSGANAGALYCHERGNIMGVHQITLPEGHTWQSFSTLLLESMPAGLAEHFRNKIAVFLAWWASRGFANGIPDESPREEEKARKAPSWRRICKSLLRNDYWCKGLSFTQTKSTHYVRYKKLIAKRRATWKNI